MLTGDTLYAASRVIDRHDYNANSGVLRFKLVGVKNERPATLLAAGLDLFEGEIERRIFEIERRFLTPRRAALPTR